MKTPAAPYTQTDDGEMVLMRFGRLRGVHAIARVAVLVALGVGCCAGNARGQDVTPVLRSEHGANGAAQQKRIM